MKKFRFRLEPLLKLRQHRERERQKEHAEALQKVQAQNQHLAAIDQDRSRTLERQRSLQTGKLSTSRLLAHSRYLLRLKGDTMTGREVLRSLEQQAERRRQNLVEAARQRQIYEKLRERRKEAYYKESERRETIDNDETALNSFRTKATAQG